MSTATAISMFELEMVSAELLPSRETLCAPRYGHSSSFSFSQANYQVGLVNVGLNIGSINL